MSAFLSYIHEFHPYDALFVVPVVVSAWMFWKQDRSSFTFLETLFGSAVASTFITLAIMGIIFGAWSLIGITAGLILGLYAPICAAVGMITLNAAPRIRNSSAQD